MSLSTSISKGWYKLNRDQSNGYNHASTNITIVKCQTEVKGPIQSSKFE